MNRPNLSKGNLGEAARQMICARLLLNGVNVYRPLYEDTPTDLLILKTNGEIKKCQCKYIYPVKNGSHEMPLCTIRKNGPNSKAIRHKYTKFEVDFFLGYCLDNDSIYTIPYESVEGKRSINLWIFREPKGKNGHDHFNHMEYKEKYEKLL
jgi:PD-(D/E)XK endonuclease